MHHSLYYTQIKKYFEYSILDEQAVTIGVSGGSDSMYLLYYLQRRRQEQKRQPSLLHIVSCDHNTRANTKNEIEFVQSHCRENTFFTDRYQGSVYDESTLRTWRHDLFVRYCQKHNCKILLLGHHLDDRIETTFLNINRGCGKKGLTGLHYHTPHFLDHTLSIVRPLLCLQKKEILADMTQLELTYCNDPSNTDTSYSQRNMIRSILSKHYNGEGFYKSMESLYEILEANNNIIQKDDTRHIIYDTHNNPYYIHPQKKNNEYLITITNQQRTPDLLYTVYSYFQQPLNPRSHTLETLAQSLHKKSGNKIIYQGLQIQASQHGSTIKITK